VISGQFAGSESHGPLTTGHCLKCPFSYCIWRGMAFELYKDVK